MGQGNDDGWEMPKPVFRSSTGSLPKSFEETISQSFSPDTDTVEVNEDDDILGVMDTSIAPPPVKLVDNAVERVDLASQPVSDNGVRAKAAASPPKRAGMPLAIIFLVVALVVGAIAAVYWFLNRVTSNSTF